MALNKEEIEKQIVDLKILIRESAVHFFEDEELLMHLGRANNDVNTAAYNCLIIKAEECSLNVSGLSITDSSAYWLRLAALYRPNYTTVVKGG